MKLQKWVMIILSLCLCLLGVHGLYATFDKLDTLNALTVGTSGELFFSIKISFAKGLINWMSTEAFQSIFMPVVFTVAGIVLFINRNKRIRW